MKYFPLNDLVLFHFAKTSGKRIRVYALDCIQELVEMVLPAIDHVSQNQYCKLFSNNPKCVVYWTAFKDLRRRQGNFSRRLSRSHKRACSN